ncbi:MAG: hypothetical protein J0I41_07205 [Filimonas sp.]|nr:hypothetical protein [Filimonas sp.]
MADLEIQLKSIQDKLQLLMKQYQAMQKENQQLKRDLEDQAALLEQREDEVHSLTRQLDGAQIGAKTGNSAQRDELQKRIDTYLKEIEKCLSLLND